LLLEVVDHLLLLAVHSAAQRNRDQFECVHRAIPARLKPVNRIRSKFTHYI
ncbi:MAG: hypothetical protein ACI9MB_005231, partial [Verrucomicrobiales bacterium]